MTARSGRHQRGLAARRIVAAPVPRTMAVLLDLRRHAAAFPFTTMSAPSAPARVGDRFVAVTAGVVRDEMVLERRSQTRGGTQRATFRKVGGLFRGTVLLTVAPAPAPAPAASGPRTQQHVGEGSLVVWAYDVWFARGPRRLARWPATLLCTLLAKVALRDLARQAEREPVRTLPLGRV